MSGLDRHPLRSAARAIGALGLAVAFVMLAFPPAAALAAGGHGGGSQNCYLYNGGSGGTGSNGQGGGPGGSIYGCPGAGGGGGGAGGGTGGDGGAGLNTSGSFNGGNGGAAGTAGDPGTSATGNGNGGGGGGGGGGGNGLSATTITNTTPLTGTAGGAGGNGGGGAGIGSGGGGGGGGAGGYGAIVSGNGTSGNTSSITGGNGGKGGDGGSGFYSGYAGDGGDGGVGVQFTTSGATFTNTGTVTGGNGGARGTGNINGANGSGGVGVVGSGLTIDNTGGTITGGVNGDAISRAFAVAFTGGTNSIGGGTIIGGIDVTGGSFAPALTSSAIGTPLAISGPLTFGTGTQYVVRFSPTASDYADVTGAATLGGASVDAEFSGGSTVLTQYAILHASTGLSGTFGSLTTNLPSWLNADLGYGSNDVYLNLAFTAVGANANQQRVIDALNSGTSLPIGLFTSSSNDLSSLDGEVATGARTATFQLSDQFLTMLLGPLYSGASSSGGQAMGYADERPAISPAAQKAYDGLMGKPKIAADPALWASAYGGVNEASGDAIVGSSDTDTSSYGLAAGAEGELAPGLTIGAALAAGGTRWDLADGLGTGKSYAAQGGVYARAYAGSAYLSVAGAFANHWFSTDRVAGADRITADFQGVSYGVKAETGYRFASPRGLGVTPLVAGGWQALHTPAYSEQDVSGGGLGLSYAAHTATDTLGEIGVRFDKSMMVHGQPLFFFSRFAWAHHWGNSSSLAVAFSSLPGTSFAVNGAATPKDAALVSVGAQMAVNGRWSWQAQFDGAFGEKSQTYGGSTRLAVHW